MGIFAGKILGVLVERGCRRALLVVGGGAAGFFAAIAAKMYFPWESVTILEGGSEVLRKVRISGGGRCNVTHACFDIQALVKHYPRGQDFLVKAFASFQPRDTVRWFEEQGVVLKQEPDGRMFPSSNTSASVVSCLKNRARAIGVHWLTLQGVRVLKKRGDHFFVTTTSEEFKADRVILATGSSPLGLSLAKGLGHTVIPGVPSLFTFTVASFSLSQLSGVAVPEVEVCLDGFSYISKGELLITHWGFSGPAILKLSAFGALFLAEQKYQAYLGINWIPGLSESAFVCFVRKEKKRHPQKSLGNMYFPFFPRRLWHVLCSKGGFELKKKLGDLELEEMVQLYICLAKDSYSLKGKSQYKEEFVQAGGVDTQEVSESMESTLCKNLFFAGEILNVDGVTGGFNFQNAWTTGWLAGRGGTGVQPDVFCKENSLCGEC